MARHALGFECAILGIKSAAATCRSTLVSLLQRHYDPTEGSITLDGKADLREIDAAWFRSQLGVVSQNPRLFSETISENIAYGKDGLSQVRAVARPEISHAVIQVPHASLCHRSRRGLPAV